MSANTMFLIFPGMTDFEEVEIIAPASDPGYCYVRPLGSDDEMKVSIKRLVDQETARARTNTTIIESRDDFGRWTTTEHTVRIF